jgi:hypothetical protein
MDHPATEYEQTEDTARRPLEDLFFSEIFVGSTVTAVNVEAKRSTVNNAFRRAGDQTQTASIRQIRKAPRDQAEDFLVFDAETSYGSFGLNKTYLVSRGQDFNLGPRGYEPRNWRTRLSSYGNGKSLDDHPKVHTYSTLIRLIRDDFE